MPEMKDQVEPFYEGIGQWVAMIAVIFLGIWLWISWRNAWFPFGALPSAAPAVTQEQAKENVLNSLSATSSPKTSPAAILKDLTPAKSSKTTTIDTDAVLDSLTPKK